MSQGGHNGRKLKTLSWEDQFLKLPDWKKRLVWLYYLAIATNQDKGLKTNGSVAIGGVEQYSCSGNIKYHIASNLFRYHAEVSVSIALIVFLLLCCFL